MQNALLNAVRWFSTRRSPTQLLFRQRRIAELLRYAREDDSDASSDSTIAHYDDHDNDSNES